MHHAIRALLLFAAASTTPALANDFVGAYDLANWSVVPITGGTSSVDLANSTSSTAVFVYDVTLSGGGVSQRTATFSVVAPTTAEVSFDWSYAFNHRWFQARGELTFFAYDDLGVRHDTVVVDQTSSGAVTVSGSVVDLQVHAGQLFGLEVGGSNFDSNSALNGTVTLTQFTTDETDCNGVPFGPARLDNCGTCDDDPTNDCVQDCLGTWGGTAGPDMCGVCDDDPSNDCTQDCTGVWGGASITDGCGTCDDDPTNDCTLDCAGVWGGASALDRCSTCDDDPTNDCVQDCAGAWGGTASVDMCGTCDDDPTNDCVEDCDGAWGGTAAVDACGVCSGGSTGVPVDDCDTDVLAHTGDSDDAEDTDDSDAADDSDGTRDTDTAVATDAGCACDSTPGGGLSVVLMALAAACIRRRRTTG